MKTKLQLPLFTFLLALFSFAFTADGWGQVSITVGSTTYTDEFTGFDGTADPVNWITSDDTGATASTWGGTDTGTGTGGGKKSYGDTGSGATFEGSLGFLPSSTRAINAEITFINNTGDEIIGFDIAYVAEHWRSANAGRNNGWAVSYSINGASFINLASLTYVAPNTNATGANPGGGPWSANPLSQNVLAISIPAGQTITFLFFGDNGTGGGSRQGVAIDDFSVNFTISGGGGSPAFAVNPTSLTGFEYIAGSGPSTSQSFDASGLNLDPVTGNVNVAAPANYEVSLDNTSFFDDVDIAYTTGEFTDVPVYVRLKAGLAGGNYNGDVTISGGTAANVTVAVSGMVEAPNYTTLPYNQTFDTDLGDTYVYNVAGTSTWMYNSGRAEANGFGGSNPEEQWLVLPGIDFTAYSNVVMTFKTFAAFGALDANNYLKLFYSTDYDGVGDPTTATWTEVIFDLPSSITSTETETFSGLLDLSAINNNEVFLAFKYLSTNSPTRWRIDDIDIMEASALISVSTATITNLNYSETNGPSASQSFDVSALSLTPASGDVTVTAPANFEVSTDDVAYSASVDLPYLNGELASTPVYVRLQSGLSVNTYNGNVAITGGGASPVNVAVSGEVSINYDGMETFENFPETGSSYASGSFAGVNGNTWNYVNARGNIIITNETVTLQNNATASLNSVISGGLSSFSFDYMQAFSNNVNLEVYVNGNLEATVTTLGEQGVVKNSGLITLPTPVYGSYTIEFKQGSGGNQVAIDNLNWMGAMPTADYTWENGLWFPTTPVGNSTSTDDLLIVNGTAVLDGDVVINNIYVLEGATLEVENILSVNGDLLNDGMLILKSTSVSNTAQLGAFSGAITGIGEVQVERFIPARRAFRLLSSSVTTSGTINANWQEGVNNPDLVTNLDPNPGFGTHITGSMTGANGFDATPSGNPSLFTLDNATQLWVEIDNTDINTISAGKAYRLMVRGDRSIDVTDNSAAPTNTVLRTTGALHTGSFATTDFNENAGAFNFFGNPYPATVDMNAVLTAATNVNNAHYYVWDPTMGTRGAYVTVDLPLGTGTGGSVANQYLQPGQAAFVTTLANGPASLSFEESHKAVTQPLTQVFNIESAIDLRMYTASAFAQSEKAADGLRIKFSEDYTNAVTPMDAVKYYNLDENLATENTGSLLSIESRDLPQIGESIPLYTDQYRTTDYVFEAELSEVNGIATLLLDHYTGTTTELANNDTTLYAFQVDSNIPLSMADDRFEIVFEVLLSTDDVNFGNEFVLFPNPAQGEINIATRGIAGQQVQLSITGVLGQTVYNKTHTVNTNGMLTIDATGLSNGVYILKLSDANGGQFITKFIKK